MNNLSRSIALLVFLCAGHFSGPVRAQQLDLIGVTLLRAVTTNVNGAGVWVGQVEAESGAGVWEIDPTNSLVLQPANRFTYFYGTSPYASVISTNAFPNSLGIASGHAIAVAAYFFGLFGGVATNIAHVNNYEANTFINYYVNQEHAISERIVNQSFTFGTVDTNVDQLYDNYAVANNVLIVSGAGFPNNPVWTPATCYNGIGVGVSDNLSTPYGPTPDGRSKPDICAPHPPNADGLTSYTTPQVSGAAVLLMQAGLRGDGGSGSTTNLAVDIRTIKALLLNGAIKPTDWTNSVSAPLHSRYGAGMLNIFNSYKQLTGGKQGFIIFTTNAVGGVHPPTNTAGTVSALSGWDYNTNTSGKSPVQFDAVNHYYFNVTNNLSGAKFIATATLVWNKQYNKNAINNLQLFLYNCANSNLVACSTSLVDNVEHIYKTNLAQGRYDLQVWKAGGSGIVSAAEPYALAFEFFSETLSVSKSGTNTTLTWPVYPAGFVVESATNLIAPVWINNLPSPTVTNNMNNVKLNATNPSQFFRLRRPNF